MKSLYEGETSRNTFTRSSEHVKDYEGKKDGSVKNKHFVEKHGGERADFEFKGVNTFKNDT